MTEWKNEIPRWGGETVEPPESKKDEGYIAGDRPPAKWENWLRKGTYEAVNENRNAISKNTEDISILNDEVNNLEVPVKSVNGKTGNVNITSADVGLGSVLNYGVASKAQAEATSSNALYMTPLRTKEAMIRLMSTGGVSVVKSVQRGFFTGSKDAPKDSDYTISISGVNVNKSVLIVNALQGVSAGLINATTLSFKGPNRSTSGVTTTWGFKDVEWQVIEFY